MAYRLSQETGAKTQLLIQSAWWMLAFGEGCCGESRFKTASRFCPQLSRDYLNEEFFSVRLGLFPSCGEALRTKSLLRKFSQSVFGFGVTSSGLIQTQSPVPSIPWHIIRKAVSPQQGAREPGIDQRLSLLLRLSVCVDHSANRLLPHHQLWVSLLPWTGWGTPKAPTKSNPACAVQKTYQIGCWQFTALSLVKQVIDDSPGP